MSVRKLAHDKLRKLSCIERAIEKAKRQSEDSIKSAFGFHTSRFVSHGSFVLFDALVDAFIRLGLVKDEAEGIELIFSLLEEDNEEYSTIEIE